jgi:uncharacterized protein (TIGR04255 family)
MTYSNAPIREAVLDIKVSGLENKSFNDFQEFYELIKNDYPNSRTINAFALDEAFPIKINNKSNNEIIPQFQGIIFSSNKSNRQVQFRRDGFTYNFLAPYTNWNDIRGESKKLWDLYLHKFPEIKIERMALRYINRIVIPRPFDNIEEFVVNVPPIPKGLPQIYKSFFSQIEVQCDRDDYSALINSTIETPTPKEVPFILDIDVFKMVKGNFDFNDFDYIRNVKNSIFESCITDKARTLFK